MNGPINASVSVASAGNRDAFERGEENAFQPLILRIKYLGRCRKMHANESRVKLPFDIGSFECLNANIPILSILLRGRCETKKWL